MLLVPYTCVFDTTFVHSVPVTACEHHSLCDGGSGYWPTCVCTLKCGGYSGSRCRELEILVTKSPSDAPSLLSTVSEEHHHLSRPQ